MLKQKPSATRPAADPYPKKGSKQSTIPQDDQNVAGEHLETHENHVEDHDGQTRGEETVSLDGTDSCVSCGRKADDDAVECQWCSHWEHKVCAKVSSEHYLLLDSTSQNIMFFVPCVFLKFLKLLVTMKLWISSRAR